MNTKPSTAARGFVVLHNGKPCGLGERTDPAGRILRRGGVHLFRRRSAAQRAIARTVDLQTKVCAAFPKWKYADADFALAAKFSIAPQFTLEEAAK